MPIIGPDGRLYELSVTAAGEVRDGDGNLIEQVELGGTVTDPEQAAQIIEALEGNEQ